MEHDQTDSEWPKNQTQSRHIDEPLKYRKRALLLLILYIPLIIIPWALTCVLAIRPLHISSYFDQRGILPKDVSRMRNSATAVNVLNSMGGLITIPIISALLAQAAVVFTQRRSANQALNVKHLFALADRGWTDIPTLFGSLRWNEPGGMACKVFLWLGATLIVISSIQQPLYQILVPIEVINVPTCLDTGFLESRGKICRRQSAKSQYFSLGSDIEPYQMEIALHNDILPQLVSSLASVGHNDMQPNLWMDTTSANFAAAVDQDPTLMRNLRYSIQQDDPEGRTYFVAALETNTTTGVLREHLMRMNSSTSCEHIDRSKFPSTCSGERPLVASFSRQSGSNMTARVCVPGRLGKSPWTLSRNRQDLTEEIFLDVQNPWIGESQWYYDNDFTIHCRTSTTRGYFELGNYRNMYVHGPLLEKWPSLEEMHTEFNDYAPGIDGDDSIPSEYDPGHWGKWKGYFSEYTESTSWNASGPLMMSATALFGSTSFFNTATNYSSMFIDEEVPTDEQFHWQGICNMMPFNRLFTSTFPDCQSVVPESWMDQRSLLYLINDWIHGFNDTSAAEKALSTSMFLANQAMLTIKEPRYGTSFASRAIYSAPGVTIKKPTLSLAAKITISVLIAVQFISLALLTYFIYHVPTWTYMLNAMAVARITASLDESSQPLIGSTENSNKNNLDYISGVIGVVDNKQQHNKWEEAQDIELSDNMPKQTRTGVFSNLTRSATQQTLGVGAPGVITRNIGSKK